MLKKVKKINYKLTRKKGKSGKKDKRKTTKKSKGKSGKSGKKGKMKRTKKSKGKRNQIGGNEVHINNLIQSVEDWYGLSIIGTWNIRKGATKDATKDVNFTENIDTCNKCSSKNTQEACNEDPDCNFKGSSCLSFGKHEEWFNLNSKINSKDKCKIFQLKNKIGVNKVLPMQIIQLFIVELEPEIDYEKLSLFIFPIGIIIKPTREIIDEVIKFIIIALKDKERVVLCGHSMGGSWAQIIGYHISQRQNQNVDNLYIVSSGAWIWSTVTESNEFINKFKNKYISFGKRTKLICPVCPICSTQNLRNKQNCETCGYRHHFYFIDPKIISPELNKWECPKCTNQCFPHLKKCTKSKCEGIKDETINQDMSNIKGIPILLNSLLDINNEFLKVLNTEYRDYSKEIIIHNSTEKKTYSYDNTEYHMDDDIHNLNQYLPDIKNYLNNKSDFTKHVTDLNLLAP